MIALDELTGGEVSVVLKPGMAWAIYNAELTGRGPKELK